MTKYITSELADKTKFKTISNAYQTNDLSIVIRDKVWYFEKCSTKKVEDCVKKEMGRLFPEYEYLFGNEVSV